MVTETPFETLICGLNTKDPDTFIRELRLPILPPELSLTNQDLCLIGEPSTYLKPFKKLEKLETKE